MTRNWIIGGGIFLVALVGIGALLYFFIGSDRIGSMDDETISYVNGAYGISFQYPGSYRMDEAERGNAERGHYAITLIRNSDFPLPENGEGPVSIDISLYQNNLDQLTLEAWLTGSNDSNFKLSPDGVVSPARVDGAEAVRYRWSGLYEGETTAFLHGDSLVAVSVTYLSPSDDIRDVYEDLLDSITLR